jgi:hypothetical protein
MCACGKAQQFGLDGCEMGILGAARDQCRTAKADRRQNGTCFCGIRNFEHVDCTTRLSALLECRSKAE